MLGRTTREITEDITALLSLLSTVSYTGVNQDFIQNFKEEDNADLVMDDIMSPSQDSV